LLKVHEIQQSTPTDLAELDRPSLEAALAEQGHEPFRARQVFAWIYRRGITDIDAMTDLSRELRTTLAASFTLTLPRSSSVNGQATARRSFCCASPTAVRSSPFSFLTHPQ
jgi:adenine C2-methylase RlmN of 23S rRNA A2503 and tRNA A37